MPTPFIPNRDPEFDVWLANYAGKIAANPAAYGISGPDAAALAAAQSAWHAAYTLAAAPRTRTAPAIADKDAQRKLAVALVRRSGAAIRANVAVPLDLKLNLGLRVRAGGLTRGSAPTSPPALCISDLSLASHTLTALEVGGTGSRAKPKGVAALLVVRTIADAPAQDPNRATFLALATRTPFTSSFTSADGGRFATYFARWTNSRGQLGPWSAPVSMRIAA